MALTDLDFYNPDYSYNGSVFDTVSGNTVSYKEPNQSYDDLDFGSNVVYLGEAGSSKYDEQLSRQNVQNLYQFRAENQPGTHQLFNMLNQAVVGEVLGGTLEGVGHLLDIKDAVNTATGAEEEVGNLLVDLGKGLRTWTQDVSPIYESAPGQFAPGKWSWWMSNAPSVASTLSLLIPATGTIKGVSMLGKAMGMTADVAKIAKGAGLSARTAELVSAGVKGVSEAVVSRHIENLMEASNKREEVYNRYLKEGLSQEDALKYSAQVAADIYNKNWVMLAQDIPQYLLLGKKFGSVTGETTAKIAKELGQKTISPRLRKAGTFFLDALGEGGEEAYQYIVSEAADDLMRAKLDPTYRPRKLNEFLKDEELWTSAAFGMIGAGVFQGAGRVLNNMMYGNVEEKNRVQNIKSWGPTLKFYDGLMKSAEDKNDISMFEEAKAGLIATLAGKAAEVQNMGQLVDSLESIMNEEATEDTYQRFGLGKEDIDNIKKTFPDIIEQVKKLGSDIENYRKGKIDNTVYDPDIASSLAILEMTKRGVIKRQEELNVKKDDLRRELEETDYKKLSLRGKQLKQIEATKESYKQAKDYIRNRLKNDKELSDEHKEFYNNQLKDLSDKQNKLYNEERELKKSDLYTKEERDNDSKKKVDPNILLKLSSIEAELTYAETELARKDKAIKDFKKLQDDRKQGKKPMPTEPEPKTEEEQIKETVSKVEDEVADTEKTPEEKTIEEEDSIPAIDNKDKQRRKELNTTDNVRANLDQDVLGETIQDFHKKYKQLDVVIGSTGGTGSLYSKGNNVYLHEDSTGISIPMHRDYQKTLFEAKLAPLSLPIPRDSEDLTKDIVEEEQKGQTVEEVDASNEINIPNIDVDDNVSHRYIDTALATGEQELVYIYKDESELANYLENPNNDLSGAVAEFSIDFGNTYYPIEESVQNELKRGNKSILTEELIDNLPIKITINDRGETVPGNLYFRVTNNVPKQLRNDEDIDKYKAQTKAARSKIINSLVEGNRVITNRIRKDSGNNFNKTKGQKKSVTSALNISLDEVRLGVSIKGGAVYDRTDTAQRVFGNVNGGNIYLISDKTPNGDERGIHLNKTKLNKTDANIVLEAFRQAYQNRNSGNFKTEYKGTGVSEGQTIGRVLSYLVYNNRQDDIDPKERMITSKQLRSIDDDVYRQKLLDNQIYSSGSKLHYGQNVLDLRNITKEDRDKFIAHATKHYNYPVTKAKFNDVLDKPFTIGSIKLTEDEVGITTEQFYVKKKYVTTDITPDQYGNITSKVNLYMDLTEDTALQVEKKAEPKKKGEKTAAEKREEILRRNIGYYNHRYEGKLYLRGNVEAEKAWIDKRISDEISTIVSKDLLRSIDETGSYLAFGQLRDASIYLYERLEEGTGYHEAFHVVSLYYFNDRQRRELYRQAKESYNLNNKSDREVEEFLAELFREYIISDGRLRIKAKPIDNWFKRLLRFIVDLFVRPSKRISDLSIEKLFNSINDGEFKQAKINPRSFKKFRGNDVNKRIAYFTSDQTNTIINQLLFQMITATNVLSTSDISKMSFKPAAEFVSNMKEAFNELRAEDPESERLYQIYSSILNNRAEFEKLVYDRLYAMNIKLQPDYFENQEGTDIHNQFEDDSDVDFTKYDKASFEYNSRDNLLANVKLFIATLPANGKVDSFLQMPDMLNFGEAWSKIMKDVWNATDFNDIVKKLEQKAENDLFYKVLLNGRPEQGRVGLLNAPKEFQDQFEIAVSKHRHNFINVVADRKNNLQFIDAAISRAERDLAYQWSLNFYVEGDYITPDNKPNNKAIAQLLNRFNKDIKEPMNAEYARFGRFSDIDKYLNSVSQILNDTGVNLTPEDLLEMSLFISRDKKGNEDMHYGLHHIVNDILFGLYGSKGVIKGIEESIKKAGDKFRPEKVLATDNLIVELAKLSVANNIYLVDDTVLGADNATYYVYSPSSLLTDYIKLLKDDEFLKQLSSATYNKNSYYLKQINEGKEFNIVTFGSFRQGGKADDYLSISDSKDFLIKLNAIHKGYIPLPTLADRKAYYMYTGISPISIEESRIVNGKYVLDDAAVSIIEGYAHDERNRIAKVKSEVDNAIANKDYKGLVRNIHYQTISSDGIPVLKDGEEYLGNGAKYIHFTEFNTKDFNESTIRAALRKNTRDTLDLAEEYGYITVVRDKSGGVIKIKNKGLGQDLVEKYKDKFGTETLAIYHIMANYTINTISSTIETEKLIGGDIAYYKQSEGTIVEDKIKRLNALVAPGTKIISEFTEGEFKGKTKYNTAIIRSLKYNDKKLINKLAKRFTAIIQKNNPKWSDERVAKEVSKRLSAYTKIDVTDAQTYVTPRMYRELLIRMGEWKPEVHDKAYDVIMNPSNYSKEEQIKATQDLTMQPLKLVYFGPQFINNNMVPIYDKMSVAVLLPEIVKDTYLEPLYNQMIKDGIDMIKYDSAVKVGNTGMVDYFDSNSKPIESNLEKLNDIKIAQDFKFLRKQQVTDPHDTKGRLLGTQVKKVILGNLKLDQKIYKVKGLGDTITGREVADLVFKAYSSLSNKGRAIVVEKLGINDKGILNADKLYSNLKEQAIQSNMPYDLIEHLYVDAVTGKPAVNLDTLLSTNWIESRMISTVTKNTVDLIMPGTDLVQMSNGGLISASKGDLDLFRESDGKTEIKVSVGLFKRIIPDYNNKTFEQKKQFLKAVLEGIGYRIPTQGQNSTISFIITEFLPEETGNTVILPYGFTALTGSDFDIDKLFVAVKNYYSRGGKIYPIKFYKGNEADGTITDTSILESIYKEKYLSKVYLRDELLSIKERIDAAADKKLALLNAWSQELTPEFKVEISEELGINQITQDVLDRVGRDLTAEKYYELLEDLMNIPDMEEFISENTGKNEFDVNSDKAVQNFIINLMSSVLENEEHILETKTPLDTYTGELKSMASELKSKTPLSMLQASSPKYQVTVKDVYTNAKKGIGPFALNNVHHSLTQINNTNIEVLHETKGGEVVKVNFDLSKMVGQDDVNILDWLSALINAHVDVAKDPYIFYLNVNQGTYNTVSLLIRSGFGKNSFWMINQPGFKEEYKPLYEKAITALKTTKPTKQEYSIKVDEIATIIAEYSNPYNVAKDSNLLKYINEPENDYKYWAKQAGISIAFSRYINPAADKLSNMVRMSRIDNKGFGKTLGELQAFDDQFQALYAKDESFREIIDNSFLSTLYENSVKFTLNTFSNLTIRSTKGFRDILRRMGSQNEKALYSAILSDYFTSTKGFNLNKEYIKAMFVGESSLGYTLNRMILDKDPLTTDNKFVNKLKPVYDSERNIWFIKALSGDKNDPITIDSFKDAWKDLLESADEDTRQFGLDLIYYSFYTSGFNKSLYSFYNEIPIEKLKDRPKHSNPEYLASYDEFVGETIAKLSSEYLDEEYVDKVIANASKMTEGVFEEWEGNFQIKNNTEGNPSLVLIPVTNQLLDGKNSIGQAIFRKNLTINNYGGTYDLEYVGYKTGDNQIVYRVLPKYGVEFQGHKIIEPGYEGSLFNENKTVSESVLRDVLPTTPGYTDFVYVEPFDRTIDENYVEDPTVDAEVIVDVTAEEVVEDPKALPEVIEEDPFLSDEQIELIKQIPLQSEIAEEREQIINAIRNMKFEEAKAIIDQIKNCS